MRSLKYLLLAVLLGLTFVAHGNEAAPAVEDPVLEKRVNKLSEELRCLVCQNQTIADSHADLAVDLKNLIREKLKQGLSDQEVKDFMVERYGDFVLYRPPVKTTTWLLWFGPFALLAIAIAVLVIKLKSRARKVAAHADLSADELRRAQALLGEEGGKGA
jgi:cytochrome c-type biogenesis protein CcmH